MAQEDNYLQDENLLRAEDFSELSKDEYKRIFGDEEIILRSTSKDMSDEKIGDNLGLYRSEGKNNYRTGRYAGYTWLKDNRGEIIRNKAGQPVVFQVKSRFNMNISIMLNTIATDEEFENYLCLDSGSSERLFTFFFDEPLISAKDSVLPNRVIAIWSYVIMLKRAVERPLMRKMVKREKNYVGKVKGKILVNKHINKNVLRGHEERLYCSYNEKTEDIVENQVLKYALQKAEEFIKAGNSAQSKSILRYISVCRLALSKVSEHVFTAFDVDRIQLPSMYKYYIPLLQLAKVLIMENNADVKLSETNNTKVIPYAVNLPLLFECFCRTVIKQNLERIAKKLKTSTPEWEMLKFVPNKNIEYPADLYGTWNLDPTKKSYISGFLIPDIVLRNAQGKLKVYDVKYKAVVEERIITEKVERKRGRGKAIDEEKRYGWTFKKYNNFLLDDRRQILAYAKVFGAVEIGHILPGNVYRPSNELGIFMDRAYWDDFWIDEQSEESLLKIRNNNISYKHIFVCTKS